MKRCCQDKNNDFFGPLSNIVFVVMAVFSLCSTTIATAGEIESQEKETQKEYQLEKITVTAQKKKENAQDLPMSASIFSDMVLEDTGIEDMSDLVLFTPNVFLKESSAENELVIRGISSFNTSIYSPAGVYVDGVNLPLHYMYNTELFDIERVEVLRGPQGTLYGRNCESGVLNIITKQPDNELEGKALLEYGNYNSWRYGANISGPIVENQLFLGVSMQYKLSDGYIENKYNDDDRSAEKDHKNGRATLRWTPMDRWDISFIADVLDTEDQQNSYRYRTGAFETDSGEIRHNVTDEYSKQEGNGQTLRLNYGGDAVNVISVTGFRKYSHEYDTDMDCTDDLSLFNWGASPCEYEIRHMSQEIRLSSPENQEAFEWLIGGYGFKEDVEITNEKPLWGMSADTDMNTNGYAFFGQATYTLFDKLHLTAGLRFDHQDLEGTMEGMGTSGDIDLDKDLDYEEWLPKFSTAYDFSEDMMVYASVSKGYMVGGYNYGYMPSSEEAFCFDAEYTWNYEVGIKSSWLDNRLITNLAFFYIDIDDKQVVEWSMLLGNKVENAASAHSQGIELELQARPLRDLTLFAGFGYAESKFDDWKSLQDDGTIHDFEDNYLPNAPKYTYNLGIAYRNQKGFFSRADLLGTGEFYGDAENNTRQEAYEIVNLRFGYEADRWDIVLWCKNLFDEEYVTALYDNSDMGLGELVQDGEPRMIGLTATYRF